MTLEQRLTVFDITLHEEQHPEVLDYCPVQQLQEDITARHLRGNYRAFESAYSRFYIKQYGVSEENLGD